MAGERGRKLKNSKAKKLHIIAIGGNSEASAAGGEQSMRQLSNGDEGGQLANLLLAPRQSGSKFRISCDYFSWTGAPRTDTWWIPLPPMHLNGANRITRDQKDAAGDDTRLIVVGWSNGGDTAYNTAKKIAGERTVDALITLDPVSRVTSLHWVPFMGSFDRPEGVKHWFHAYTTSWGSDYKKAIEEEKKRSVGKTADDKENQAREDKTNWYSPGNFIAAVGGAWNSQPSATVNLAVAGNHGHTLAMLDRITSSQQYRRFVSDL